LGGDTANFDEVLIARKQTDQDRLSAEKVFVSQGAGVYWVYDYPDG
jgi:hypothetical protein